MTQELNDLWDTETTREQVAALIERLSIPQKVALVSDHTEQDTQDLPDDIPEFVPADGPAGVRIMIGDDEPGRSTSLPAPILLAATWDTDLARQYGDIIGLEMVATGHNVLFGPAVDIARVPVGGRTFESFGEDPLLQSRMIVAEVRAIQAHGIQCSIKHYILNNQEYQRSSIDVHIDESTLRHIYLPPFAAAIEQGQATSLMGSYNRVRGVYACENSYLLSTILREQLGFQGWVISDYMATPSTAEAANAGLDKELGSGKRGHKLVAAVEDGQVPVDTLNRMVRHLLDPSLAFSSHRQVQGERSFSVTEHGELARTIAEQGIVLLKNQDELLPLSDESIRSVVIIGADADNVSAAGGGSANVQPSYGVSVLEGIQHRLDDDIPVHYEAGTDPIGDGVLLPGLPAIPSDFLRPSEDHTEVHGTQVKYWDNPDFSGEPDLTRIEPFIETNCGFPDVIDGFNVSSPKLPPSPKFVGQSSSRWTAHLTPPVDGEYLLSITAMGTVRFFLNGELLIDSDTAEPVSSSNPRIPEGISMADWSTCAVYVYQVAVNLVGNESCEIQIDYAADSPGGWFVQPAVLRLGWAPPSEVVSPTMQAAIDRATQSDVAIIVARTYESEEFDRSDINLPRQQGQLIRLVSAVNPRTIVVVMSGGPVETESWEASVPGILEAWYAGQEQGNAIARVLFGDVNPCGKLPLSFPHDLDQTPVSSSAQYPGIDGLVRYSEGQFVGYRGYEFYDIEPMYPFGFGLSYTTFEYDGLEINPSVMQADHPLEVSFDVTNTGKCEGAEIAQIYLQFPPSVPVPPKQLVGWAKVSLKPGETRRVTVTLDSRSPDHPFSYWDDSTQSWVIALGEYSMLVGASSRDIRCQGTFQFA